MSSKASGTDARRGVDVGRQMAALSALHKELDGVDVVVGDWIDASTMWASHLLPAQARMVVRTHSLDILDPWLHFVDWDAVKTVMTPHSAFAGLLSEITADLGAPQPQVMPPIDRTSNAMPPGAIWRPGSRSG